VIAVELRRFDLDGRALRPGEWSWWSRGGGPHAARSVIWCCPDCGGGQRVLAGERRDRLPRVLDADCGFCDFPGPLVLG